MAAPVLLAQASAAQTASGSTAPIQVPKGVSVLAVNVNVTAVSGTSPTLLPLIEGQDALGNWYPLWTLATDLSVAGNATASIGPGCYTVVSDTITVQGEVVPPVIRFRWTIGGTSPSFTFSASIIGRDVP